MEAKIITKKYKIKDINLNVAEIGEGKPLVFIHGWSNSWIGWSLLAHELASNYHLYMIDLPGFGDSDRLEKYSLEIVATYVAEFIKKYVPKPKALIGGSGGTFVAAEVIRQTNLSTNLIFIGTMFKRKKIQLLADVYKKILSFSANKRLTQKIFEIIIKSPYSAYLLEKYINAYQFDKQKVDQCQVPGRKKITGKSYVQIGFSYMDFYMDEFLDKTTLSTFLLFGKADKYVTPFDAQKFVANLNKKNISLGFIEKAGHSPAYEQPEKTAEAIKVFLKK